MKYSPNEVIEVRSEFLTLAREQLMARSGKPRWWPWWAWKSPSTGDVLNLALWMQERSL